MTRTRAAVAGLAAACLAASMTRLFAADRAHVVPFVLDNGIIYLQVGINGSSSRSFILDTGALYTVLDLPQAKALALRLKSMGPIEGAPGANPPEAFRVLDPVTLSLPGVAVTAKGAVAMTLARVNDCAGISRDAGPARPMDGILGKPFFDRFVVEVDYAARVIRLHEPRSYKYSGRGVLLPIEIGGSIYVRAQVQVANGDTIPAQLVVDTGASAPLALRKSFTDAHALLPPREMLRETKDCGVGGEAEATSFVGAVDVLRLGDVSFRNPLTVFVRDPDDADDAGTLGNGALTRFRVIFDYARRRMILEDAKGASSPP